MRRWISRLAGHVFAGLITNGIMKTQSTLAIAGLLVIFSCNPNQEQSPLSIAPKVVEAKTHKVPLEKIALPTVIPVSGVKRIIAGKPEIVQLKSNVFPAKVERIVPAGVPMFIIPGGGSFKPPRVVPAID